MAQTMKNPAMTAHQMLLLTAVAVAIMNILLMVRHTSRSLPVGRLANLNA